MIVDDLIRAIVDRFKSFNFDIIDRYGTCVVIHHICRIHFYDDYINIYIYLNSRCDEYQYQYDELTDIDVFVGFMLSKRFYGDK